MKIIDTCIFYNELDLLSYRLHILDPYVDAFVIVESTHTFSGHKKPLYYGENKSMFQAFHHKIVHVIVEDVPYTYPSIQYQSNQQWENEYHQRNSIKRGVDTLIGGLSDDDILLTSDVDEIPDPTVLRGVRANTLSYDKTSLNRLALDMDYYNLCCRVGEGSNWHGVKLLTVGAYRTIHLSFQQMRIHEHSHPVPVIPRGGWHLSYFGDVAFITNKIASFSHQEYNHAGYLDRDTLERNMKEGINLLNNSELQFIPIEKNTYLPYEYTVYLSKYIPSTSV